MADSDGGRHGHGHGHGQRCRRGCLALVLVLVLVLAAVVAVPRVLVARAPTWVVLGIPVADAAGAHRWLYGLFDDDAQVVTTGPFEDVPDAGWVVVNLYQPKADGSGMEEPEPVTSVAGLAASLVRRARRRDFPGAVASYMRHDGTMRYLYHRFKVYPDQVPALERIAAEAAAAAPPATSGR